MAEKTRAELDAERDHLCNLMRSVGRPGFADAVNRIVAAERAHVDAEIIRDAASRLPPPSCELCLGGIAATPRTCSHCGGTGLELPDSGRARQYAIDVRALEEMADEIACGGALHPRG